MIECEVCNLRTSHIVYGAFVLGVAISLLESVCTGQVYLPTITFIKQYNHSQLHC